MSGPVHAGPTGSKGGYRRYMLLLLMVIMASNYIDRITLGLLMQDIKTDLALSDTQLGLLTGIAFAFFYSLMGIPIARWADRGNRVAVIGITAALWSIAVALCGAVGNFAQLLLVRVGVAVGEAGCVPPAHSLIADHFDRAERPRAVAIYKLGLPLSTIIGYFGAGWLNEWVGWRMTFVFLGLPGLLLAVLAWFSLREPRNAAAGRSANRAGEEPPPNSPSLAEVALTLWANRSFRHLVIGYSVAMFFNAGIAQWTPAFFIRSHGISSGALGTWFALTAGFGGFAGILLSAALIQRFAAGDEQLQLRGVALAYLVSGAFAAAIYIAPGAPLAFAAMALVALVGGVIAAPLFATVQSLVPDRMRAMSIAILFLFSNLIGLGLGPLAVGIISDHLAPTLGAESLRRALIILCPGYLWCAWHIWAAAATVTSDLGIAEEGTSRTAGAPFSKMEQT